MTRVLLTFDTKEDPSRPPELLAEVSYEFLSISRRVDASVEELQPHGLPSLAEKTQIRSSVLTLRGAMTHNGQQQGGGGETCKC